LREAILNAICEGKVPKLDRLSIVRDLRAEMVAGRGACSAATFVAVLTHAFRDERDFVVWAEVIDGLRQVELMLWDSADPALPRAFNELAVTLLSHVAESLKWEAVGTDTERFRDCLLGFLLQIGHGPTLAEARRRFDLYTQARLAPAFRPGTPALPENLKQLVFSAAAREASVPDLKPFFELHQRAVRENDVQERAMLERALCSVAGAEAAATVLRWLSSVDVRRQDRAKHYAILARSSRAANECVAQHVTDAYDSLCAEFDGLTMWATMLKSVCAHLSPAAADAMRALTRTKELSNGVHAVEQGLEEVCMRTEWRIRDEAALRELLKLGDAPLPCPPPSPALRSSPPFLHMAHAVPRMLQVAW
jgi:hypothetical protein